MASKFSEFLEKNKIDPRRLLVASRKLERLRPEDRTLERATKKGESGGGGGAEGEEGADAPPKPRSGRPVTPLTLKRAQEGASLSGPAKTRLLRAVNLVLEQKKKDPAGLRDLF